jgi:hypothetical protein
MLMAVVICMNVYAQEKKVFERKGFVLGFATGVSSLRLSFPSMPAQTEASLSFPNIKIGAMLSKRTALLLYLPGSIYTFKEEGRERDRGFEGIIPSVQFWLKDRWWVLGGVGLGVDAPAFYDIQDEDERKFYFGSSVIAGTGYEVWRKGKFALDVQARVHYGSINHPQGTMEGLAFNFLVGLNWY